MAAATLTPKTTSSGEYDFDWDSRNDMRGAWLMCATTGFTYGKCPKVFIKCWKPPMIYITKTGKIKTHCIKAPKFSVSKSTAKRQINEAWRRLGYKGEPPSCDCYDDAMEMDRDYDEKD